MSRRLLTDAGRGFAGRKRTLWADAGDDPMASMGNLFDVAVLIGVGFMIMALSSFGLKELVSGRDVTIVKNPGTDEMEIITKSGDEIRRLSSTDRTASGAGTAIGTVYRLESGDVVWVPGEAEVP